MRRFGRGWRCAAVLAGLMSAALARGEGAELRAQETAEDGVVVYGRADYAWTIRPLDGEPVELEAFRGKVLFINLWASWCTPCIREMETIERLKRRLADTDVEFLIVAAEGERPVRRHLRKYRYDLPIYLEVDRIPEAFGVRGLPTSWLVDRAGRILVLRHGEAVWDTDEVEAFVRAVADG